MLTGTPSSNKPKLLDQVREVIRRKHYSIRTEQAYCDWIKRFILFHRKRHPAEMAEAEITAFLTHLAAKANVAASTQNQALSALLFLYREVLRQEIGWLDHVERAKKPARLPVVLTRAEVRRIFAQLRGTMKLMAGLLYGSGLRLMECVRLRVKDVDLGYLTITLRDSKGGKDRVTMLPTNLAQALQRHLLKRRSQHEQDLVDGFGSVHLPHALARKYPNANREWMWQYVFASSRLSIIRVLESAPPSHRRERSSAHAERCNPSRWNRQDSDLSHPATFIRNAFARARLRHPDCAGAARPFTP